MKKFLAIVKYLFFPFLMTQASDATFSNIIGNDHVVVVKAVEENVYWVGTNNGLWIINGNTEKAQHLTAANSILPSNHVTGICVTSDRNVYVSTDNGIFRFDGYSYMLISTENANLPSDHITAIMNDSNDNLWVGTDKGLVLMNSYMCRTFNKGNSVLTNNAVKSITVDIDDNFTVTLANNDTVLIDNGGMKIQQTEQPDNNAVANRN